MSVPGTVETLIGNFSLEMTAKDVSHLQDAGPLLPAGTRLNVTFLGNESLDMRVAAANAVAEYGLVPVPHLAARRMESKQVLEKFLGTLSEHGNVEQLFVVAGDPSTPDGPYPDAASIIETDLLQQYGVKSVGVAGYPDGHPNIGNDALWSALEGKVAALRTRGLEATIVSQFGFDVDVVIGWVEEARARGIDVPIRIGVPGPAGVRRLLSYAARFGVSSSASIARKYGLSFTNLLGTAGPNLFIDELASRYDPLTHGRLDLHFYTFGGLSATSTWIREYRSSSARM